MTRRATRIGRRNGQEDGVVLVIVALAMVALLVVVALVIDYGFVRNTRQANKTTTDVAVAAGLRGLESPDGIPRSWSGVCAAARYVQANRSDLTGVTLTYKDGTGLQLGGNPCANPVMLAQPCNPANQATWAWVEIEANGGAVTFDVKSGYVTPDSDFAEDAGLYASDNGAATFGGCDQLAVIANEDQGAFFGTVAGTDEYDTTIRSVGRVTVGETVKEVVALLLLEQTSCSSLVASGNNTFVYVRATPIGAPVRPGLIHSNSNGSTDCTGSARVLEGSGSCPAISNCLGPAGPSIVAEGAGAATGRIGVRAVTTNAGVVSTPSCPSTVTPTAGCTVSPTPTDRGIVSRQSVDERFLTRVQTLRATAVTETGRSNASATTAGYHVVSGGACNGLNGRTFSATAAASPTVINTNGLSKVFLNCNVNVASVVFDATIKTITITGDLSVGSGSLFEAASPERMYIGGGVTASGTLRINRSTSTSCAARAAAAQLAVNALVVLGGGLNGGAQTNLALCSTFLFLANGALPTTMGTDPSSNSYTGRLDLGAQTVLDWTAPNQSPSDAQLTNDNAFYDNFEDLALWTERSGNCTDGNASRLGGQGAITATGVFFLPNACPFAISGGGSGAVINADAQFIVRRLSLSGTVALTMAPNPANAIPTPRFESFSLVR